MQQLTDSGFPQPLGLFERAMRCILAASLMLVFGALAVTIPQEVHNLGDDSESLVEMEAREGRFREFTRCTLCRHFQHPAP